MKRRVSIEFQYKRANDGERLALNLYGRTPQNF